jgi:hypothetical protein
MRDVAALEALQGRLARFHMHWAKWQAAQAGALGRSAADPAAAGAATADAATADAADAAAADAAARWRGSI